MNSIDFRLPWPPSLNTYYVCVRRGPKVLSKKGREYAEAVDKLIKAAGLNYGIDCDVEVEIKLAPPRNGKWDGDNYTKALFDSITKSGVWADDSLVMKYSVEKLPPYAMGEVYISIIQSSYSTNWPKEDISNEQEN
jgi:crossover junction endodeoxyribonuclease RusA